MGHTKNREAIKHWYYSAETTTYSDIQRNDFFAVLISYSVRPNTCRCALLRRVVSNCMGERINESCAQSAVVTFIVIMLPLILLVSCGRWGTRIKRRRGRLASYALAGASTAYSVIEPEAAPLLQNNLERAYFCWSNACDTAYLLYAVPCDNAR